MALIAIPALAPAERGFLFLIRLVVAEDGPEVL